MTDSVQNTAANRPITGSTVLTISDNFAFLFNRMRLLLWIAFVSSAVVATTLWLLGLSNRQSAEFLKSPWLGLQNWFVTSIPITLGYVGLVTAITVLCSWLSFTRLPIGNRQLTFHADAVALKTSDATGAVLSLPWALVRKTRVTPKLLLMQMSTRAWRFLPLRAFSADDQRRLIALAQRAAATHGSAPKD
jgi:hypothetical protein